VYKKELCGLGLLLTVVGYDQNISLKSATYEGWNFNSGNYLFTIDTK